MGRPVISVENVGKRYRLRHQGKANYATLRETLTTKIRQFTQRPSGAVEGNTIEEFWALQDVSFEVARGDIVGIIGRNGAGKSTLLKILSRITEPTEGRIRLGGRVASLLEVGTGFHPELTGRENIFLNGAILGMTKAEIRSKFDEIVAFAEVERFLDTPVKHYSSGMYVRLAFAVAAHLEPEILVVDEVLAVGDTQFQQKCIGKMEQVSRGDGRTILFVSHNMGAVCALCKKGLVLNRGRLIYSGDVQAAITEYKQLATGTMLNDRAAISNLGPLRIASVACSIQQKDSGKELLVDMQLQSHGPHRDAFIAFDIVASTGAPIMQALPIQDGFLSSRHGSHRVRTAVQLPPLTPGQYSITAWTGSHYSETLDTVEAAAQFEIHESPTPGRTMPHASDHGFIVPSSKVVSYDFENGNA